MWRRSLSNHGDTSLAPIPATFLMTPFEFVTVAVSFILGLGVTQLLSAASPRSGLVIACIWSGCRSSGRSASSCHGTHDSAAGIAGGTGAARPARVCVAVRRAQRLGGNCAFAESILTVQSNVS